MPERITFVTDDGATIVGDWVTSTTTVGAVILVHTYQTTRQAWAAFQRTLSARGLASLAIDLRGHGESVKGPDGQVLDHTKFKEGEDASSIHDVRGAQTWIRSRGIEPSRIAAAGASIGANLVLEFLGEQPQMPAVALLSPGEEYHGINALEQAEFILPHQSVWMAASSGDDQYSVDSAEKIMAALVIDDKTFVKVQGAGHALKMFDKDPGMMDTVGDWLRDKVLAVR